MIHHLGINISSIMQALIILLLSIQAQRPVLLVRAARGALDAVAGGGGERALGNVSLVRHEGGMVLDKVGRVVEISRRDDAELCL